MYACMYVSNKYIFSLDLVVLVSSKAAPAGLEDRFYPGLVSVGLPAAELMTRSNDTSHATVQFY